MPKRTYAQEVLYFWEYSIDAMGFFEMPDGYVANTELNKYDRFTGFVKEWVSNLIHGTGVEGFEQLDIDRDAFPENWWKVAARVANGKDVNTPIPKIKNLTDDNRKLANNAFIPAYRALKASFEGRRWYEWIFNHSQYTAERDTIKALEGLMMSLTGATREDIDAAVEAHVASVPNSGITPKERRETIREVKEDRIYEVRLARARKWDAEEREKYGSREDSESEYESKYESKYESDLLEDLLPSRKNHVIFTGDAMRNIAKGYNFSKDLDDDDGLNETYIFDSNDKDDKKQVLFGNEFADLNDSFDIQKPVDEKNDPIIENINEIGF